jgi:small subunit ribosomal protein S6
MEKTLNAYELMYVIDALKSEDEIAALVAKFSDLIAKHGEIESVDEWGKRRLAYEIDHKTEGYYVLVNFKSDADFPAELNRVMGITDGILRCMVIRK